MLGKLKGLLQGTASGSRGGGQDQDLPTAFDPGAFRFRPMTPLQPPAARNDDVMRPVYDVVEQDLRDAGYLRAGSG